MILEFKNGETLLSAWVEAINAKSVDRVVDLYSRDAILFPTFATQPRRSIETIREYFTELAEEPGLSVILHTKSIVTQMPVKDLVVLSGLYRFTRTVDEIPLNFEARFTFFCDLKSRHPILHHHSSQLPRGR